MVTEDYVSFEIAKLLKKKRFSNDFCQKWYNIDETEPFPCPVGFKDCLPAPTLQMAMKWLRKAHSIDIEVRIHYLNYLKSNDTRYYSGKILKGSEDVIHTIFSKDTYEEVCEAGIKYCLENLI